MISDYRMTMHSGRPVLSAKRDMITARPQDGGWVVTAEADDATRAVMYVWVPAASAEEARKKVGNPFGDIRHKDWRTTI